MAKRQRLETEPGGKFIDTGILAEQQALVPYAVKPLAVQTGLIRSDHPGHKRLRIQILADVLRPFMHIEEETHSMTGAVAEIPPRLPERRTGRIIYLAACSTGRENRHGQSDMAFQHQCIVLHFQPVTRPERNSPGNISRTEQVLSAGIAQIKSVRLEHPAATFRSDVMRQCCRRSISGNGLETVASISLNLST